MKRPFLFLLLLLAACQPAAEPVQTPMLIEGGETLRLDLEETAPDDVEQRPFLLLTLDISNAQTEQPIAANVWVWVDGSEETAVCQNVAQCQIQLAAVENQFYWLRVEAQGYGVWENAIRARTFSSRSLTLPVRLHQLMPEAKGGDLLS